MNLRIVAAMTLSLLLTGCTLPLLTNDAVMDVTGSLSKRVRSPRNTARSVHPVKTRTANGSIARPKCQLRTCERIRLK